MLCSALQGMSLNSTQSSFRCGSRLQQQARPRPALLAPGPLHIEAAHKKGGGSTKNGRDSKAKRRGVKVYGGQPVKAGGIIVRQVGATFHAGVGTALGKDYTLFALSEGIVEFKKSKYSKRVNIIPFAEYQVPEGNLVKEGSRKSRKREQYPPRAQMREQLQSPVPAATS